jgi:hypothetical protein
MYSVVGRRDDLQPQIKASREYAVNDTDPQPFVRPWITKVMNVDIPILMPMPDMPELSPPSGSNRTGHWFGNN